MFPRNFEKWKNILHIVCIHNLEQRRKSRSETKFLTQPEKNVCGFSTSILW